MVSTAIKSNIRRIAIIQGTIYVAIYGILTGHLGIHQLNSSSAHVLFLALACIFAIIGSLIALCMAILECIINRSQPSKIPLAGSDQDIFDGERNWILTYLSICILLLSLICFTITAFMSIDDGLDVFVEFLYVSLFILLLVFRIYYGGKNRWRRCCELGCFDSLSMITVLGEINQICFNMLGIIMFVILMANQPLSTEQIVKAVGYILIGIGIFPYLCCMMLYMIGIIVDTGFIIMGSIMVIIAECVIMANSNLNSTQMMHRVGWIMFVAQNCIYFAINNKYIWDEGWSGVD
eukprot:319706_1